MEQMLKMLDFFKTIFSFLDFHDHLVATSKTQRKTILHYVILTNLILISAIFIFSVKLHGMKAEEDSYINEHIQQQIITKSDLDGIKNLIPIDTKLYAWRFADINMKEKDLVTSYRAVFTYKTKDFPQGVPPFDIFNGVLLKRQLVVHSEERGLSTDVIIIQIQTEPKYMIPLYPLDKELVTIRLSPATEVNNYYFKITDFGDYTQGGAQTDYDLVKMGFTNSIEKVKYPVGLKQNNVTHYALNRGYMLFTHKSIYAYLKNIQYLLLSLLIALVSLLINPCKADLHKADRVGLIASSVFALTANIFQVNSMSRSTNSLTVLDLITFFSGLIIVLCFITTVRTIRFIDRDGYHVSKLFDLAMFSTLFLYIIFFFSFMYYYA